MDFTCNRVNSYIMKRCLLLQLYRRSILLCRRCRAKANWNSTPSRPTAGAQNKGHMRKEHLRLNHSHFVQNTITNTHQRVKTTCCKIWVCLKILKLGLASTRQQRPIAPRHPRDHGGRLLWHESRLMTKLSRHESDYTKIMKEKDVYRNLHSVRDIRTLLLH